MIIMQTRCLQKSTLGRQPSAIDGWNELERFRCTYPPNTWSAENLEASKSLPLTMRALNESQEKQNKQVFSIVQLHVADWGTQADCTTRGAPMMMGSTYDDEC